MMLAKPGMGMVWIPLLAAAGGATFGGGVVGGWDWITGKIDAVGDAYFGGSEEPLSTSHVPVARPPIAPQTGDAMVRWSPAYSAEVYAQVGQQYQLDNAARTGAAGADPPEPDKDKMLGLLAVAGLALAAGMLLTNVSKR